MFIHLRHTELVTASPERLFSILTDYEEYPRWNRNVISATTIRRDEHEAEVEAERSTFIGKKVHFIDTYAPRPLLQFERRYVGNKTAKSIWTVEPAHDSQAYFTIEAEMTLPFFPGIFQRPILRRMFYRINFPPFISAAESFGNRMAQPSF